MAVINEIPGLEVTVEVEGRTAKEYVDTDAVEIDDDDQNNDDLHNVEPGHPRPHVVKYIEVKPGATFKFCLKRTPDFKHFGDSLLFKAIVDGRKDNTVLNDLSAPKYSTWYGRIHALYSEDSKGNRYQHAFKFGNLNIGEMDSITKVELKRQTEEAKDLGILRVQCFHGGMSYLTQLSWKTMAAPSSTDGVSEKALKGKSLDCQTTFHSKPCGPPGKRVVPYLDRKKRPFAIFEFRYRSRKGLIDEGIIPRPPPGDMVSDMSDDEVRRLARELLLEREKANGTKKEDKKRGIKREGEPMDDAAFGQRYKTHRSNDGYLEVDLTGDD